MQSTNAVTPDSLTPSETATKRTGFPRIVRRGATAVEFALVLPVFFLFIFAVFEFSRVAVISHVVDNASYEACRAVIVPGAQVAEAEVVATEILQRYGITEATIAVTPNPIREQTSSVTVSVEAPVLGNGWGVIALTEGITLNSSTTLLTERSPTVQAAALPQSPPPPPAPDDNDDDDSSAPPPPPPPPAML